MADILIGIKVSPSLSKGAVARMRALANHIRKSSSGNSRCRKWLIGVICNFPTGFRTRAVKLNSNIAVVRDGLSKFTVGQGYHRCSTDEWSWPALESANSSVFLVSCNRHRTSDDPESVHPISPYRISLIKQEIRLCWWWDRGRENMINFGFFSAFCSKP